jgi:hypothetical protein
VDDKIYLTRDEQKFLLNMLELKDINVAVDEFAIMMAQQGADPIDLQSYLKKIMLAWEKKIGK